MDKPFQDISEWYTPNRIEAEELQWKEGAAYKMYAQKILEVCKLHNLSTVIEVGCGTGWVPTALDPSLDYIAGIDKNPYMIAMSRLKNPLKTFIQCDICDVEKLGLSADLVCSFAVLKHFSLDEWPLRLRDLLGLGRFGLFTQQMLLDGRPSMDVPDGLEENGTHVFHSIWPTGSEVLQSIEKAGHKLFSIDGKSLFNEGIGAPESIIVTRRKP